MKNNLKMNKTKFKQTEIGEIPVDWETDKVGNLYSISSGLSKGRKDFVFGFPFVSFKDIF